MKPLHILIGVFAISLSSCGGGDNAKTESSQEPAKSMIETESTPESTDDSKVKLILSSNDQMQFDKTELRVKEGQTVTLELKHTGTMPKATMGHNFVLLKEGTDMAAFANQAMQAVDNDYIPENTDVVIAHTNTIGGKESASVTFPAPPKGTYQFLCTFPGHYALMNGKFIVE